MTWGKILDYLVLTFVSFQGVLLLTVPEYRNRVYGTVAQASNVAVPLLQSIAEHGRLIVSVALIPTCFLPNSWIVPRFISLISYVIYICIIHNLYLFNDIYNIGQLLVQGIVLIKLVFILVEDLTQMDIDDRKKKRQEFIDNKSRVATSQAQASKKALAISESKPAVVKVEEAKKRKR